MTPETKSFNGDFLLYRKDGSYLRRKFGGEPRFRHKTWAGAEAEAERLLGLFPDSTFVILQEVGRVKLKADPDQQGLDWIKRWRELGNEIFLPGGYTIGHDPEGIGTVTDEEAAMLAALNADDRLLDAAIMRCLRRETGAIASQSEAA